MTNVKAIRPRALPEAYSYARMNNICPNCGAAPGEWCRRADGHYRRIPCVKRIPPPNPEPMQRKHNDQAHELTPTLAAESHAER
jgi:hypothetical protein